MGVYGPKGRFQALRERDRLVLMDCSRTIAVGQATRGYKERELENAQSRAKGWSRSRSNRGLDESWPTLRHVCAHRF